MVQPYSVKSVTVLARGAGVLVREFVFAPGEATTWHRHSAVTDIACCVLGEIVLETQAPDTAVILRPGERGETPAGQVHRLVNRGEADCALILIQSGGAYDFLAETPAANARD